MSIFTKKKPIIMKVDTLKPLKEIKIQAATEGSKSQMDIESLMLANNASISIPGITNSYTDYASQTEAIYDKYNSKEAFGNQLVRTIIDFRTTFIGGEGISVSCEDEKTSEWIENFLTRNHMNGSTLINLIKSSEMSGQALAILEYDKDLDEVRVYRRSYNKKKPYRAKYDKNTNKIIAMQEKKELNTDDDGWVVLKLDDYIYIRTGGDDRLNEPPTTRTGVILTDIDNYDRAIKDIRRNNHVFARITPTFEVNSEADATALQNSLLKIKWKIGTAFIGKAKFKYETPTHGTHENLATELTSLIKTISAITGIPVHWLGYVDLMANRATAESLYEMIKNSTLNERLILQEAIYDLILKAQELYINNGGSDITLNKDFDVKLPLIDFSNFLEKVRSLKIAYDDEAISIDDYRNEIPGINPLKTKKAVEAERDANAQLLVKMGITPINNIDDKENTDVRKNEGSASKRLP